MHSPRFVKVASLISAVFNPLFSLLLYFLAFSVVKLDLQTAFSTVIPAAFLIMCLVFAWIFIHVRKGAYTNMDVSDRNQRRSLYFFIVVILLLYLLFQYFFKSEIDPRLLFLLILLIALQISNFFIKSSMHTALNLFTAGLFYTLSPATGLLWLAITLVVAYTRTVLQRHTWAEIFTGAAIGGTVTFLYLYSNSLN